jgi:uncharacterized protein (DUF58 family)
MGRAAPPSRGRQHLNQILDQVQPSEVLKEEVLKEVPDRRRVSDAEPPSDATRRSSRSSDAERRT